MSRSTMARRIKHVPWVGDAGGAEELEQARQAEMGGLRAAVDAGGKNGLDRETVARVHAALNDGQFGDAERLLAELERRERGRGNEGVGREAGPNSSAARGDGGVDW